MSIVKKVHETADCVLGKILKKEPPVPCKSGCFWCCKESVIASDEEVIAMLELLTPEEKKQVADRTRKWMAKFNESNFGSVPEPPAYEAAYGVPAYRSVNLWCPLLSKDGKCMAYSRRPLACRMHIAHGTNAGCQDDELRRNQKYALFPGLIENLSLLRFQALKDGERVVNDHLGILLAKELLGIEQPTAARVAFSVKDNTMIIEKYSDDEKSMALT